MGEGITGVALAGGRSVRMGRDKAQVVLHGMTLLELAMASLLQVCHAVMVVTSPEGLAIQQPAARGARLICDVEPGRGPLGGLYSGLRAAATEYVLLVGCDTPFLQPALLRAVVQASVGREAALPLLDGVPQPLHGVYSRRCLPAIEALLASGRPGLRDLLPRIDVRYLEKDEVEAVDPRLLSFFNVNTEAELEQARLLLEGGGP